MGKMVESQSVSSLPLPPLQFLNLHSEENIRRARVPRPPPIFHDVYSIFGVPSHTDDLIIRPLESQGIKRLYPQNFDHKKELKKMNHSILVNFLDLLDILIKSPGTPKREEKIDDINLLFIHMHHLINEFRPHQARETLRVMMEVQRRQRLETTERFQKHLDKVIEILQSSLAALPEHSDMKLKLFSPSEPMDTEDKFQNVDASDISSRLDIIMCDIIDNI